MNKKIKNRRLYCLLAVVLLITLTIPSTLGSVLGKYVKEFEFQTGFVSENTFSVTYYIISGESYQEFQRFTLIDGQTFTHTYTGTDATAIVNQNGQTLQSRLPEGAVFKGWTNAAGAEIQGQPTYSSDMVLFANYTIPEAEENVYQITIYDGRNNILGIVNYTDDDTKNTILAKFPEAPDLTAENMYFLYWGVQVQTGEGYSYVNWSDFTLPNPRTDLVIRPQYEYRMDDDEFGDLQFVPVDSDGDGVINYYRVEPIRDLPADVVIPGEFMGLPVREIEKLYDSNGNKDQAPNVVTVTLGEGVEIIRRGALAATPKLITVNMPSTIKVIESQILAINSGVEGKKDITINYNGSREDWENITKDSNWAKGAQSVTVICSDQTCVYGKDGKNPKWTKN